IGSSQLIERRKTITVAVKPGGVLADYVPFYLTPGTPMLLNIVTGRGGVQQRRKAEIVVVVSSVDRLRECACSVVFSDRHAAARLATLTDDPAILGTLDWPRFRARDFVRDLDDPDRFERYEAEVLVHSHVPLDAILGLACYDDESEHSLREAIANRGLSLPVKKMPRYFF
ncbi:MAG: DUF4433 domain-containing protein, partial [Gemmatimonadaceae bacterium]|nr:DUF4433 domain-containing protein [Gemmatimonadaceae bacterium]